MEQMTFAGPRDSGGSPSTQNKGRKYAVRYLENPSQSKLRELALQYTPAVIQTRQGSLVKVSRNKNRVAQFTYVIASEEAASKFSLKALDRTKAKTLIARQAEYIQKKGTLISVEGYLGVGSRAVAVEWLYTLEGANIAGMQKTLAFPRESVEGDLKASLPFRPEMRVVYTPDCFLDDMPGRQAVIVDLDELTTYIMGPDYFGESKKGALRMLNFLAYQRGGLVLHAGAKVVQMQSGERLTMTVMGESGTGKTTTTFSKQGELTQPLQDDMVTLWSNGEMSVTENGCFAKTEGLTATSEPIIYESSLDPRAWLENVYVDMRTGEVDFLKSKLSAEEVESYRKVFEAVGTRPELISDYVAGRVKYDEVLDENGVPKNGWDFVSWTQNGRSIVPMSAIRNAAELNAIPPVKSMGILNRDEGPDAATPGLVRFTTPEQAAGFFMLGETSRTSAAGKERGKMRSPFTQPFFPQGHQLQAKRFRELAATMPGVDMWMMNTGCIGGDQKDVKEGKALKVKIAHSSAILEAMLSGEVKWVKDPDFGYEVVDIEHADNQPLLAKVPAEILQPRRFFEGKGRGDEYRAWVLRMKQERREFLQRHEVEPEILRAVEG